VSFPDLRTFIAALEARGELVRVREEVDPDQEITVIMHRVLPRRGPALLFENVKGSSTPIVTNLFGTPERIELMLGSAPAEIGKRLQSLHDRLMPPSPGNVWSARNELWRIARSRLRDVRGGPVLQTVSEPANIDRLPVLTCWPKDGGPFFTLPLVHTVDPRTGVGNLGIYRLQRFDAQTTGMHWQIERGGHVHFRRACELGVPLPVSVVLGGPPALTFAAIAPLPEGVDERLLCAFLMGRPLDVIRRPSGHRIPARAEFVLEGDVRPGDMRLEGPFGDHFGHYSRSAEFPVFRVARVLARRDAIYPATVVGKPIQEDFWLGIALQELFLPVLKILKPGLVDLWAYPETGFHPLAVLSVRERYPREALKHALGVLGEGQVSLSKVMIVVDRSVPVRDIRAVSQALWENLDAADGLHLLAPTAQDTLDFTGPRMNTGSRLILLATHRNGSPLRQIPPPAPPDGADVHPAISDMIAIGPSFLAVQVGDATRSDDIREALAMHPVTRQYLFHVLLSPDVPLGDPMLTLWGWFTRFDPLADLYPATRSQAGNRLILGFPIAIDAQWKPGYPEPLAADSDVEARVDRKWDSLGISLE